MQVHDNQWTPVCFSLPTHAKAHKEVFTCYEMDNHFQTSQDLLPYSHVEQKLWKISQLVKEKME